MQTLTTQSVTQILDIYSSKRAGKRGDLPKDPKYYIHTSDIADIVSCVIRLLNVGCLN
jgi:hypothetical protein